MHQFAADLAFLYNISWIVISGGQLNLTGRPDEPVALEV